MTKYALFLAVFLILMMALGNVSAVDITSYTPSTPHDTASGGDQKFEIFMNQTANVTWYLNGNEVFNETDVNDSSYTFDEQSDGTYNVTASAENAYGSTSMNWVWTVNAPLLYSFFVVLGILALILSGYSVLYEDLTNYTHIICGFLTTILWFILGYQAYIGVGYGHVSRSITYSAGVLQTTEDIVEVTTYQYGWLAMLFVVVGVIMALYTVLQGVNANKDLIEELEEKDEMENKSFNNQ